MQVSVWVRYLFGQAEAIHQIAKSRAALWTGIALVLLTAIPRSYDQTYFFEKPLLWIFGPLLFSLVSGSWLYATTYVACARREMMAPGDPRPKADGGWFSFMGLFWMTAPVAWLYAIPVERFMDSLSAAKVNVTLLSIVSLWRVVLMARVLQVTTRAPLANALIWVLFAASVEVLVVFFFGGAFAKSIMAGMGGMRNSPEENIMLNAMTTAFTGAFWIAPVTLVLSLVWTPKRLLQPLPVPVPERVCWPALGIAACLWVAVAIIPQRELANTVKVEQLIADHQARAALDVLASHQPRDFAPARTLPPKPFERSLFEELPLCFGALQASDPEWVRKLMLSKLDTMISHGGLGYRRGVDRSQPHARQVEVVLSGLRWHGTEAGGLTNILSGLQRIPEGKAWIRTNGVFIEAVRQFAMTDETAGRRNAAAIDEPSRTVLSNLLWAVSLTNDSTAKSNSPPVPAAR